MAKIQLVSLRKTYEFRGQLVRAVDDVTLEAPEGKILTLLGPSGCGKTTTLRCVAGLERPDDGEIRFGDRVVFSRARGVFVPPEQRHIGMVFQSYAIWPHMTVFENVAYPLRVRRVAPGEVRRRVQAALELVGLAALADRPAPYLSGGQQQRVALARALVYEPQVLLLDEPLSNLDAKVREQVREELRTLQRQLNITTVYVTHDQIEALALSDVVAVMRDGKVLEVGSPRDLYERPRTRFVAQFLGTTNLLPGRLAHVEGTTAVVETPRGVLHARADGVELRPGESVLASVRPEHVTVGPAAQAEAGTWLGTVRSALFEGSATKYRIDLGDFTLLAYGEAGWNPGDRVALHFDAQKVILLRDEAS
jgi:iron(III) transport system ATP-binding protein